MIDALDEARPADAGQNRLLLPRGLPPDVFFIVTTRPEEGFQVLVDNEVPLTIKDRSKENMDDVRAYVTKQLEGFPERLRPQIARWRVTEADFVTALCDISDGNFLYLVQLLRDIREKTLDVESAADIRHLPKRLADYYERHYSQMSAALKGPLAGDWQKVLAVVAVGRAPLTASYIARGAGLELSRAAEALRSWRMFLNSEAHVGAEPAWRIYHASFRDFLEQKLDLGRAEDALIDLAMGNLGGDEV